MTDEQILPCGCDPQGSPVFWNGFNGVVQCHKCGATYSILTPIKPEQDGAKEEMLAYHLGEDVKSIIYEHENYKGETAISKSLLAMDEYASLQVEKALEEKDREIAELKKQIELISLR